MSRVKRIDRDRHVESDPWWGLDAPVVDEAQRRARADAASTRRERDRTRVRRTGPGWFALRLLTAPFAAARRLVARSPRIRTLLLRLVIVVAIFIVLACSVGVILINNVVIGRTAELGELEDRRRELRRDNAVLGAQAARLKAPFVVYQRATKDLGMVRTEQVPEFVYLFDGSRTMTNFQRRKVAATAAARRRAAAARKAASSTTSAAKSTATSSATASPDGGAQ